MKKWGPRLLIAAVLLVMVVIAVRTIGKSLDRWMTEDAVLCISGGVSNQYPNGASPSPEDLDKFVRDLHDASVSQGVQILDGRPVDLYGTPFRVRREVVERKQTVTATSAGLDRLFDTPDDISSVTSAELPAPKKP